LRIFLLILVSNIFITGYPQQLAIYSREDSSLSSQFINAICNATADKKGVENEPSSLEQLINFAAGTSYKDSSQSKLVYVWWNNHYSDLYCPVGRRDSSHLTRIIVENDLREIANHLGPNGRLSLNLELKDATDSLTLLEFVKQERKSRARKFDFETLRFQKDKRWKNYTFYMMLFTNYEVEWAVLRGEEN
jgi:hypothetical protein